MLNFILVDHKLRNNSSHDEAKISSFKLFLKEFKIRCQSISCGMGKNH